MSDPASSALTRNPILWGAYLACSWTWCIGMFLPTLLLRDMGWAGYWVFAIPNVIGAAAMGWVIKTRVGSVEFVEKHACAIWWFSSITLAFHLYWIIWIANFILTTFCLPAYYLAACMGVFVIFSFVLNRTTRLGKAPQTALALLVFSICLLISTLFASDLQDLNALTINAAEQSMAPLWMVPVMLFGFLLCPYLDITFHHARQQLDSKKNGQLGFAIGFVGFFFLMILLTTRYAGLFTGVMDGSRASLTIAPWLLAGILIHILCQFSFTIRVHLDQIRTLPGAEKKHRWLVMLIIISLITGLLAPRLPAYSGLSGGEIIYRLFMSAYGLIFPSYILYRVIARRKSSSGGRSILWIAVTLALPFFWMGFIERQPIWLLPGMGLILFSAFISGRVRSL